MACIIKRILQFQNSVVFGPVKITDNQQVDVTNTCLFSWSNDMVCWTNWVNYSTYLKLAKSIEHPLNYDFVFVLHFSYPDHLIYLKVYYLLI